MRSKRWRNLRAPLALVEKDQMSYVNHIELQFRANELMMKWISGATGSMRTVFTFGNHARFDSGTRIVQGVWKRDMFYPRKEIFWK